MKEIIESIKKSICHTYDLDDLGNNEYLIHTDKYYDDGDELHIVLKITPDGYELTDEGHTMMWLSYEDYNFTPIRETILKGLIEQNCVKLESGRICTFVKETADVGGALSSLEQAIIQVADMRHLSRSNVASTFIDDVYAAYMESPLKDRCNFKKKIQCEMDTIEPDVYIEDQSPILVFCVNNSERAKEAFINLMFARNVKDVKYRTIVVIDDEADITKKDHKRLINTADRPIEGIDEMVKVTQEFVNA